MKPGFWIDKPFVTSKGIEEVLRHNNFYWSHYDGMDHWYDSDGRYVVLVDGLDNWIVSDEDCVVNIYLDSYDIEELATGHGAETLKHTLESGSLEDLN